MTVTNSTVDFQAQFAGRPASEVFAELDRGTKLMARDGYSTYVFLGTKWVDAVERYCPYVVETRNFSYVVHSSVEMLERNWEEFGYNVVTQFNDADDETAWVLDNDATRAYIRLHESVMMRTQLEADLHQANNELWMRKLDWTMINKKINDYANEVDMCYDYERRLELWNNDFRVEKLEGRPKDWTVGVKIPALSEDVFYVEIEATSPSKANELVAEMSVEELLENAYKAGNLHSWRCGSDAVVITNPAS